MSTYTHLEDKFQKTKEDSGKASEVQRTNVKGELGKNAGQATTTAQKATAGQKLNNGYNPANNAAYKNAMSALEAAKQNTPTYKNSYESQLQDLYKQITNRDDFSYNVNEDAMYQQYKDLYQQQGKLAMMDTMGQAAALTGGYGSSYGQSVGQQQYNAYLQNLNDVVPELYGMAYQQYQDKGAALQNQYSMLGQMADDEYAKYQDSMDRYWQNINYLQGQADTEYNRGYQSWADEYQRAQDEYNKRVQEEERAYEREWDEYNKQYQEDERAYQRRQEAYDKLTYLITEFGYEPTAEELEEAGMNDAQYQLYMGYYQGNNPTESGSGDGYTGGPGTTAWQTIKSDIDKINLDDHKTGSITQTVGEIANSGLSQSQKNELINKATDYAMSTGKVHERQTYDENYGYW